MWSLQSKLSTQETAKHSVGLEVSVPGELGGDHLSQIVMIQIQEVLLCHEEDFWLF